MQPERELLPDEVIPVAYDLTLESDLVNFLFSGSEEIELEIKKSTTSISFHSKNLSIREIYVTTDGVKNDCVSMTQNLKSFVTTTTFSKEIPKGNSTKLHIKFDGVLNDQLAGFYRSSYRDDNNNIHYIATTQFEAVDARQAFPCWDEPLRKAVFRITLIHTKNLKALSNMPETSLIHLPNDKVQTTFMETPLMSTYLLAFIVGEFDFVQAQSKSGTLVRCISVPGKVHLTKFSLDVAVKSLDLYNEYFGIPYHLPKLDLIGVPDFSIGAMENWGLITFREVDVLIDDETAPISAKQRVAEVVSHEISHMWFGNLVTMVWWDGLWLKEGFASWMQTFMVDKLFPEWKLWEIFVSSTQSSALRLDSFRSSHPIQVNVNKAEDVNEIFDLISYNKGASVVRLIHRLIGDDHFRSGIQFYLNKHKFSNTETNDLWDSFEKTSGQPISKILSTWTLKMGFPLITISDVEIKEGNIKFKASQKWYLSDNTTAEGDDEKLWSVPIIVGTDSGTQPIQYLNTKSSEFTVKGNSWMKVNYGQYVPLRVLYPTQLLTSLTENLNVLSAEDRIGLLMDYGSFSSSGVVPECEYYKFLTSFSLDSNTKVWDRLSIAWTEIIRNMKYTNLANKSEIITSIKQLIKKQVTPLFIKLGWDHKEGDDENTKCLRGTIVSMLCSVSGDDHEIISEAERRFNVFINDTRTQLLVAEIQRAVFSLLVSSKGVDMIEPLRTIHNNTDDARLRRDVHASVSQCETEQVKKDWIYWGMTSGCVRNQDYVYITSFMSTSSVGSDVTGGELMLDLAYNKWDVLFEYCGKSRIMLSVVRTFFSGLKSKEVGQQLIEYLNTKNISGMDMSIKQGIEALNLRLRTAENTETTDAAKLSFWESLSQSLSL